MTVAPARRPNGAWDPPGRCPHLWRRRRLVLLDLWVGTGRGAAGHRVFYRRACAACWPPRRRRGLRPVLGSSPGSPRGSPHCEGTGPPPKATGGAGPSSYLKRCCPYLKTQWLILRSGTSPSTSPVANTTVPTTS